MGPAYGGLNYTDSFPLCSFPISLPRPIVYHSESVTNTLRSNNLWAKVVAETWEDRNGRRGVIRGTTIIYNNIKPVWGKNYTVHKLMLNILWFISLVTCVYSSNSYVHAMVHISVDYIYKCNYTIVLLSSW